jgi:hypothetical protein
MPDRVDSQTISRSKITWLDALTPGFAESYINIS